MDNAEKHHFFKQVFAKTKANKANIKQFALLFKKAEMKKGTHFILENQLSKSLGFVYSGLLRGYISDLEGREAIIRFLEKNDIVSGSFGVNTISDLNIQVIKDSVILVASWQEINLFIQNNSWSSIFFNDFFASVHSNIIKKMASYIRVSAKERYLLFLKEYPNLINQIPQYHIANYLGITPAQLSRIKIELKNKQRIISDDKQLQ